MTAIAVMKATPEYIKETLIQLGETHSHDKWLIGDLTNALKAAVVEIGVDATIQDVYYAVASWLGFEYSARTVEYFAMLAAYFPNSVREEYNLLRMAHFAFARSMGDNNWQSTLDLAMDYFGKNGSLPSVGWLQNKLRDVIEDNQVKRVNETPALWTDPAQFETVASTNPEVVLPSVFESINECLAYFERIANNLYDLIEIIAADNPAARHQANRALQSLRDTLYSLQKTEP